MSDAADRRIPRCAAKGRVVQLELVDIDREHGQAVRLALRLGPIALQEFLQVMPGVQAGQPVIAQDGLGLRCRRAGRCLAIGPRLPVVGGVMADRAARIAHRHDIKLVPESASVLAVVAQERRARLAAAECLAQAMACVLVALLTLQHAQVSTEQFLFSIARQRQETRIDVDDREVRIPRIDQRDGLRRGIEQGAQQRRGDVLRHVGSVSTSGGGASSARRRATAACQRASAARSAAHVPRPRICTRRACEAGFTTSGLN